MNWYETAFIYISYVVHFLYLITVIGLSNSQTSEYLHYLNYFRQIYIGVTLLFVFNPLRKKPKFTEFHRKIIFISSLFLLLPPVFSLIKELKMVLGN